MKNTVLVEYHYLDIVITRDAEPEPEPEPEPPGLTCQTATQITATEKQRPQNSDQGWRIRGFEGARAPSELEGAPSHCQKHPLKTKEKGHKTSFKTDTLQIYSNQNINLGQAMKKQQKPSLHFEMDIKAPPRI